MRRDIEEQKKTSSAFFPLYLSFTLPIGWKQHAIHLGALSLAEPLKKKKKGAEACSWMVRRTGSCSVTLGQSTSSDVKQMGCDRRALEGQVLSLETGAPVRWLWCLRFQKTTLWMVYRTNYKTVRLWVGLLESATRLLTARLCVSYWRERAWLSCWWVVVWRSLQEALCPSAPLPVLQTTDHQAWKRKTAMNCTWYAPFIRLFHHIGSLFHTINRVQVARLY